MNSSDTVLVLELRRCFNQYQYNGTRSQYCAAAAINAAAHITICCYLHIKVLLNSQQRAIDNVLQQSSAQFMHVCTHHNAHSGLVSVSNEYTNSTCPLCCKCLQTEGAATSACQYIAVFHSHSVWCEPIYKQSNGFAKQAVELQCST
eukprot:19626-Heterococcus_DN1.PRE.1